MDYVKALEDLKKERRTYEHLNTLTVPEVPALMATLKLPPHVSALQEMFAQDDARREYFRLLAGLAATPSAPVKSAPKAEPAPQVNFLLAELKRLETYAASQYAAKCIKVREYENLPQDLKAVLGVELGAYRRHIEELRNVFLDLTCTGAAIDDYLGIAGRFETEAADV